MKKLLGIVILMSTCFIVHSQESVSSLLNSKISQDTINQNDTLYITPYYGKTLTSSMGNFAYVKSDKIAFQTYAGFNVLNTLRGNVPNLSITPNAAYATGGLRSNASMLVIDGLPYANNIGHYYNLNSFEYSGVYALSSGNAAALYGGLGSNGAIMLQSKTGEGFSKPSIEFNSFSTLNWDEERFPSQTSKTYTQWMFTNTVAYNQDFGKIDTRVSYQYSFLPDGNTQGEYKIGNHAFKINTGFNITPRLSARLIFDGFNNITSKDITDADSKNLIGNLIVRYQILDWLLVSSQTSLGNIEEKNQYTINDYGKSKYNQTRIFSNIFTSLNKSFYKTISFKTFVGAQMENWKVLREQWQTTSYLSQKLEYETFSLLGGAGLQLKDFFFFDFNYRQDQLSSLPSDRNTLPTYAFSSSFVFSDAFHLRSSGFSLGKIRGSIGKGNLTRQSGYPQDWIQGNQAIGYDNKKMVETGLDMSFFSNRLSMSLTYFRDLYNGPVYPCPPNSGFCSITIPNDDLQIDGLELVIGGSIIKTDELSINSKVIWANHKTELKSEPSSVITPPALILNPNPDWTGSFLNQLTWKNFFTAFLIDVRKGGDTFVWGYGLAEDASQIKLRDLSIGYQFPTSGLNNLKIQRAQISLSARNLWVLYSNSDFDIEGNTYHSATNLQKSASVSLTMLF